MGGKALSQPYPVTATAQINLQAPYLEQFSQGIPPRVLVSLLLTDFNEINYACKLGVSISGPGGLSLYTTQAYLQQSAPISLTPGLPQVLSGPDLAGLFYPDNLSFSSANGLSLEQYLNQGSLPEGLYSICFVAYDENRFDERPVSNQACGVVSMTLHDPPTIITLVGEQDPMLPQHFLFSWQPNHVFGSPVEYNLQVYRMVAGLTPDQIVSMTPPVFQTTTRTTAYLWTAADPLLEPDVEYLVLVHARDIFGANQFKNNGFSRFERFRITVGCVAGRPCDDGSDCTVNDRINAACACVGDPLPDTDADGVCDLNDLCELGDDHIDVDADGLPDACDDCVPGMACDDGDPCTLYDTYQVINGSCGCSGQPAGDYDADGICDAIDPCDLGPNNIDEDEDGYPDACDPCVVGAACDDGNPNTANDVVSWNNQWPQGVPLPPGVEPCGCAGTPCTGAADSDGDGVCNVNDQCPGSNDALDDDGDGVPNGCDQCPGQNDNGPDVDEDGIPDVCDDEILDECPGVVALSFGHREVIEKLLCPYELFISDSAFARRASMEQLTVKVGEQLQTLNADTPGFHFAYCHGSGCDSSLPGWEVLANDLTQWLLQLGYFALVEFVVDEAGIRLKIKCDKPVVFVSSKVALDGNGAKNIKFDSGECREELITRYILSAAVVGDTCNSPQYVWSTGATTPAIYIYSAPEDYSVTITCANGCVYTEEDANCLIGAPCDDNDPCTVNDHYYDAYCLCGGTYVGDADADGVCDVLDICAGENDHLDINNDSIPDCLQDCLTLYGITLPGTDDPNPGGGGSPDDNGMAGASGEQAPEGVEAGGKVPVVPNIIPCDDGDICTTGDQLILETCECVGIFRDRDQDGVCDALDQCQGFPDHYDFNNNGVPDGCDPVGAPCVDESGNVACQMVQAYCACDKVSKVNLVELSEALLSDLGSWVDSNGVLVTIEYDQEALEAAFGTKLDTRDKDGDGLINSFEDNDGDGVINLIDICPFGDDHADANNNCIPDACEDSDGNCKVDLSRAIGYMFDRDCDDGNDCTVNDFVTCECECVGQMLDGDGDGVCDEEDDCLGGDNNQDYDQDGIADACDPFIQCDPNNPTNACDDGNPCTYGDQLVYVPDSGTCLCMGSPGIDTDHDGVCDSEDVCPGFDDNLDTDTDGIPDSCDLCPTMVGMTGLPCDDSMACTILDAFNADCMCEGIYIDSDSDGVCDEDDLCPGHPDSEDYDGDGIPDGCDPPWYNIGCPSSIVFSDNPTAMGLVLSYAEGEVHPDSLPAYIGLDLLTPNGFYENAAVALAGYRIVNGVVEAFYGILDFPFEILAPSAQWGVNTLTISYSEHQKCTFCTESAVEWVGPRASVPPCGTNNENSVFPMPCPAGNHYFVNADGFLVVGIKNGNGPAGMVFDLSSIPDALTVDLTLPNGSALTGSYSVTEVIPYTYAPTPPPPPTPTGLLMGLVTNIQVGIVPINGQISFDNGLSCPYDNGSIVYNDCTPPANIYTGQPCNDNNPLTYPDYYDASCTCVGVVGHDVDGDGVHDEEDICPGFDDLLDNNGNSVPDSCECAAPVVVESKVVNGNDIEVYFTAGATYTQFVVSYVSLSGGTPATITVGGASPITIPNVLPGVTYSISLQATCNTGFPADVVSTEVEVPYDPDVFYCGALPNPMLNNTIPLVQLSEGDVIIAGDFEVTITQVTATSSGVFTGTGYISVPYFNDARVNVSFSNIFVNEEYYLTTGVIVVTGIGLELISQELADQIEGLVNGLENINAALGELENILEQIETVANQLQTIEDYTNFVAGPLSNIDEILEQLPYLPTNLTQDIQAAMDCMDNIPEQSFEECKDLLAAAIDSLTSHLTELYAADYQVLFQKNEDQAYGFDNSRYEALEDNYPTLTIANDNYLVSWKSIKSGSQPDIVNSKMASGAGFPTNLRFEYGPDQLVTTNELGQNTKKLDLIGPLTHGQSKQVFAVHPDSINPSDIHIAGQLSMIAYDEKTIDIVLVPVNGATAPYDVNVLKQKIDKSLSQAVVKTNLSLHPGITVSDFDNQMNKMPENATSLYSYEMRDILRDFEDQEDDTYYLFIVDDHEEANVLGYMPYGKEFGFIFKKNAQQSEDLFAKTIAHEIGHGAYLLEHTYVTHPALQAGSTDNLMDQGNGTSLFKYQWDIIHNPDLAEINSEEDEDNQSVTVGLNLLKELEPYKTDGYLSFLNNKGEAVSIKADSLISLVFATGGEQYTPNGALIPIGALMQFTIKAPSGGSSITYVNCSSGSYYKAPQSTPCNGDTYSNTYTGVIKPIVIRPCLSGGQQAVNIVAIENFTPTGSSVGYDGFIQYFFDKQSDNTFVSKGIIKMNSDTEKFFTLSPEFSYPLFKDFMAKHGSYAEYTKLSSFYINGLALVIKKWESLYTSCDYSAQTKKMLRIIDLLHVINSREPQIQVDEFTAYTMPDPESDELAEMRNSLLPHLRESNFFGSPENEAKAFKYIDFFSNRINVINAFQEKINTLDESNVDAVLAQLFNLKLLACEHGFITYPYEKVKIMVKSVVQNNNYWLDSDEEWLILFLMEKVPEDQYNDFLLFLETTKIGSDYLWVKLIERVDDNTFIDENGKNLLLKLTNIFTKAAGKAGSIIETRTQNLYTLIETVESTSTSDFPDGFNHTQFEEINKYIIPFNYEGFLNRLNFYNFAGAIFVTPTIITDVVMNPGDGTFTVEQNSKLIFVHNGTRRKDTFRPFDPVIIDNTSSFGAATNFLQPGALKVYPACVFYYLNEEAEASTTKDLVITTLDVVSLAIPGGPLLKLGRIGKALVYMDKVSSVASIAGTYTQYDNPELSAIFNGVSAVLGVTSLSANGWAWLKARQINKDFRELINVVSRSALEDNLAEKAAKFDNFLKAIEDAGATTINLASETEKLELVKVLTREGAQHPQFAARTTAAISKLNGALANLIQSLIDAGATAALVDRAVSNIPQADFPLFVEHLLANNNQLIAAFNQSLSGTHSLVDIWNAYKANSTIFAEVFTTWSAAKRLAFFTALSGSEKLRELFAEHEVLFDLWKAYQANSAVYTTVFSTWSKAIREAHFKDLVANADFRVYMLDNVENVGAARAWEVLWSADISDIARTSVNNLENVAGYLEKAANFNPQQNALLVYNKTDGTHFMTNAASFPDLNTGLANQKTFSYKFNTGPNAGSKDVYAKIGLSGDGYLVGNIIKTTGMNNVGVTSITEDAMDMALKHFGGIGEVRGVKALWVQNPNLYPDLPDNKSINLIMFEEALQTMSPSEAAFQTVTGSYARKRVFTDVAEIRELTEAVDGVNGYEVTFKLPN